MAEETTTTTPPAHWSAALPDPIKAHITNRGHDKEDAGTAAAKLAEAHYAAQRLIGAPPEQIVRLPKDATDPAYLEAYNRVAAFGAPKEYNFESVKFKDGTAATPELTKMVSEVAAELHLPAHAATAIAQRVIALAEADDASAAAEQATAVAAQQAMLRAAWGANYDLNVFKTTKVTEALGWDKDTVARLQTAVGGDKLMNALLSLAGKMGEAEIQRGDGSPSGASMTRDQAIARRAEIVAQSTTRKFTPEEMTAAIKELNDLAPIAAGPPPAARW
jgi:hypothetical protein